MQKNEECTDVTIYAEGKRFPCHRNVLAASSRYFRAMFTSDHRERTSDEVELTGIKASCFQLILNYVYTGEVRISLNNVQDLLIGADFLNYTTLSAGCIAFLKTAISIENCLDLITFSTRHTVCSSLLGAAMRYFDVNFESVCKHCSFLDIEANILVSLLSSDTLKSPREVEIVFAVLKWIAHDFESREAFSHQIFKHIRLPLVDGSILKDLRKNCTIIQESVHLHDIFNEAICCQILLRNGYRVISPKTHPRNVPLDQNEEILIMVGGMNYSDDGEIICNNDVFSTSLSTSLITEAEKPSWRRLATMPHHLKRKYCVTAVGTHIYVTGGFDVVCGQSINSVWCFYYHRNIWYSVPSMLHARHSHGATEHCGKLLVVGGKSSVHDSRITSVEMYNQTSKGWRELEPLPIAVSVPSVINISDKLYVIGGATEDGNACTKIQVFNIHLEFWRIFDSSLTLQRKTLRAIPIDGKIFMTGIRKPRDAVTYDPESDHFVSRQGPSQYRIFPGVTLMHDNILIIGGKSDDSILKTAECYSLSTEEWTKFDNFLPKPLYMQGCVVINA
ncbi:Kelch-like protein 24 [Holothuria leucospilota]|uniref:Kelch-like protein 24 n=1 Tax=Holothuria leucospilota TaxID=206669 RepID=A0A9Q1H5I8_HOLLE|nr:Kelch-like protein 24 [Holothuria leucospilota]